MVIHFVTIGGKYGGRDSILDKAATYRNEMVDNQVDSLMEPIIRSFLGVVIDDLNITMRLPIFSMGRAVRGSY